MSSPPTFTFTLQPESTPPTPASVLATAGVDAVDLQLDDTGDLLVDTDVHFTTGIAASAQDVRIRVQMFKGEWFADLDEGVPYYQDLLGRAFDELRARAAFRPAILAAYGVDSIGAMAVSYTSATRTLRLTADAVTEFGPVTIQAGV